jgi:hypothetical protein
MFLRIIALFCLRLFSNEAQPAVHYSIQTKEPAEVGRDEREVAGGDDTGDTDRKAA